MEEIRFGQRKGPVAYLLLALSAIMVLLTLVSVYLAVDERVPFFAPIVIAIIGLIATNTGMNYYATEYIVGEMMLRLRRGIIATEDGIPYEDIVAVDLIKNKKIEWPTPSQQIFDKEKRRRVFELASGHSPDNIVIETREKVTSMVGDWTVRYLISPENSEEFVRQVKLRMQK